LPSSSRSRAWIYGGAALAIVLALGGRLASGRSDTAASSLPRVQPAVVASELTPSSDIPYAKASRAGETDATRRTAARGGSSAPHAPSNSNAPAPAADVAPDSSAAPTHTKRAPGPLDSADPWSASKH
jgi:hypothetical protein